MDGWTWNAVADKWEAAFRLLLRYREDNGHARVPALYVIDGFPLGEWVTRQRQFRAKGRLEADREHRLKSVDGWTWNPLADKWEEGFRLLLRYREDNGHTRVPRSYVIDGFPLGQWVMVQRQFRAKGRLEADREHRLESVDGWTWGHADNWEKGFRRLQEYVEDNGDARVPSSYVVDGFRLGRWVVKQRSLHARGTLDADRERRLRLVDGWTWKA